MPGPSESQPPHQRHNFLMLTLDGLFFWLGISYYSPTTILPLFVSHLTESNVYVGAVPSIIALCWSLPQLVGARALTDQRSRKWFIVRSALLGRLPLVALVAGVWLFAATRPALTLALFFLCFGGFRFTSGLNTPAYYDLVAVAIHPRVRARFIGLSQFLGGAIGALGLFLGRALLDAFPFPGGFVLCFALGLVLVTVPLAFMASVREPEGKWFAAGRHPPAGGGLLAATAATVRQDPAFARYLACRVLLVLGSMAAAFYAVHATRRLGATDGDVALLSAALLGSQTVSTLLWGLLADRAPLPLVLLGGGALTGLATALALLAPSLAWFGAVFLLAGAAAGALAVTDPGLPLALAERAGRDRALYVALANTVLAPFHMVAPLVGGFAADLAGYGLTYALALATTTIACITILAGLAPVWKESWWRQRRLPGGVH